MSQSFRASFCFCNSIGRILHKNLHLQVFIAHFVPFPKHNIRQPSCLFVPFHLLQRNRSINICGVQFTFLLPELFMLIFLSFFLFPFNFRFRFIFKKIIPPNTHCSRDIYFRFHKVGRPARSYYAQSCIDVLQPLVDENERRCSVI